MNKKGQMTIYALMIALVIIVLALALAPPVSQFTNSARNETNGDTIGMNCSNPDIDNFTHAACIATDLNLFYFISGLIFIAGAIVTGRIIFSG